MQSYKPSTDKKAENGIKKKGKYPKYLTLARTFNQKYKCEAEKYLKKNMDDLMECKPGQA